MSTVYDALREAGELRAGKASMAAVEMLTEMVIQTPPATPKEALELCDMMRLLDREEHAVALASLSEAIAAWRPLLEVWNYTGDITNAYERVDRAAADMLDLSKGTHEGMLLTLSRARHQPRLAAALVTVGAREAIKRLRKEQARNKGKEKAAETDGPVRLAQ